MYVMNRSEFGNDECMHVCMHAFMHVFMYVCIHVCICVSIWDESRKDQEARGGDCRRFGEFMRRMRWQKSFGALRRVWDGSYCMSNEACK